ncbi:MAG: hypothetical protein LBJ59_02415 [Zoogloeaceae bacterium]|jgi:hypothetical protein|nr:hypothetical protein [Zoogloeaceae bacterium]
MIRAELRATGKLYEAILIARVAPRFLPCNCRAACCCGKRQNTEWINAIAYLADQVRGTALAGCTVNGLLRREYVRRYFTKKAERIQLDALAERYGIDRHTVSAHASKVAQMLGSTRKGKEITPGLEDMAFAAIEARLAECGMVGV